MRTCIFRIKKEERILNDVKQCTFSPILETKKKKRKRLVSKNSYDDNKTTSTKAKNSKGSSKLNRNHHHSYSSPNLRVITEELNDTTIDVRINIYMPPFVTNDTNILSLADYHNS